MRRRAARKSLVTIRADKTVRVSRHGKVERSVGGDGIVPGRSDLMGIADQSPSEPQTISRSRHRARQAGSLARGPDRIARGWITHFRMAWKRTVKAEGTGSFTRQVDSQRELAGLCRLRRSAFANASLHQPVQPFSECMRVCGALPVQDPGGIQQKM